MRYTFPIVDRGQFNPGETLTPIAWQSLSANGESETTTTTALTLEFDADPTTLTAEYITVTGATKGTLSGTGLERILTVSNITVGDSKNISVALTNPPGLNILPKTRSVTVYVQDIAVEWQSLTANGTPDEVTTTELTLEFDVDPGPLTTGSFILFNADITGISGTGTGRVLTINNVVDTELTLVLTSPTGYAIDPEVLIVSANIEDTVVPITITLQPVSQEDAVGEDVTFTATATSDDALTQQWYKDGVLISGATSTSYTATNIQEADSGAEFTIRFNNGSTTVTSNAAVLTVTGAVDNSITITQQPINRTVIEGADVVFTAAATSSEALTQQWYDASDDSALVGETAVTLSLADVMTSESGNQFYLKFDNGIVTQDTNTVTLTVNEAGTDTREPSWISNYSILTQDGNGNTDVAALIKPTSRIMYIDPDSGNDGTAQIYADGDFMDMQQPGGSENAYASDVAAFAQTRDGFPDVVLYKRGTKTNRSSTITLRRGESLANRQVVSCYGNPADAYPIINTTAESNTSLFRFWRKSGGYNTAVIGLRLTWDKRNPNHEDFAGLETCGAWGTSAFEGYKQENTHNHSGILIERCWMSHFGRGATLSAGNEFNKDDNIVIRRCTIYEMYNDGLHAQGLSLIHNQVLEEENIYVRCGWVDEPGIDGAGGDFWRPDYYKHSTYGISLRNYIRRNCLSIDPASIHSKISSLTDNAGNSIEGVFNVASYGNTFIGGEVCHNYVGNKYSADDDDGFRARNIQVSDEVMIHINENQNGGRDLAWGAQIWDCAEATVDNCIFAHINNVAVTGTYAAQIEDWAEDTVVSNCSAWNANGAEWKTRTSDGQPQTNVVFVNNLNSDDAVEGDYVAPDRDLYSYMVANSIGDGTDKEDYIAGVLEYWETLNPIYSPTALRDYIQAGFVRTAEEPLNEIAFSGLSANGSTGTTTTSTLTLTFDEDPTGLAASNITVTGATKGALSGTGTTRSLAISTITVADSETVNVAIANNNGNTFTPTNRDVTVYKEALNEIAFSTLTANGTTGTVDTDTLTLGFDEDPTGLAASDITVTGATKGALSGTGTSRTLAISAISVANEGTVNVAIADNNGNTFSPTNKDVTVYKEVGAQRLTFNGVDGYGAYTEVSIGDGDTVTFTFNSSDTFGTTIYLLCRDGQTSHQISMQDGDTLRVRAGALCYFDMAASLYDGEDHEIIYTHQIGTVPTVTVDGTPVTERSGTVGTTNLILNTVAKFGADIFSAVTVTEFEFDVSSTVTQYELNDGSTTTISASVGTGTLTLYNVVSGDWA